MRKKLENKEGFIMLDPIERFSPQRQGNIWDCLGSARRRADNGGGSDILDELSTVALKVLSSWGRRVVCSETLKRLYIEQGLCTRKTAERLGISKSTVLSHLKKAGVSLRSSGRKKGLL